MGKDTQQIILQKLAGIEELLQKQHSRPLTLEEAAVFLDMKQSYLYKLTSRGEIPYYKPSGKRIYFERKELVEWVLRNRIATQQEVNDKATTYVSTGLHRGR